MASTAVLVPPGAPSSEGAGRHLGALATWARLTGHVLGRIYRAFLLTLLVAALVPTLWSWSSLVVRTGSMEPAIVPGDVVVTQPFAASEDVPLGRVVVFHNPAKPGEDELVVHRVVENLGGGEYATAGDANASYDAEPVTAADLESRATLLVPWVGRPLVWVADGRPLPLLAWTAVTALAFVLAARAGSSRSSGSSGPSDGSRPGWRRVLRPRRRRPGPVPAAALFVATGLAFAVATPTATAGFTDRTVSGSNTWNAADDWAPPTVTMQNPGSPLKDTVALTATASDSRSGVESVVLQYLPLNGSAWVTVCTATAAPYTCLWNTKLVTDGTYDLRAVAEDGAGFSATSEPVRTTIANNLLVVLADPGDDVRGTVTLSTTLFNAGTVNYTVRVEYSPAGANSWKSVCTNLTTPYRCSWNTTTYANGDYDLRAVAVAGSSSTASAVVADVVLDNLVPTVSMADPGSPLSGMRTFAATAADVHSGVAQVVIQYARTGTTTYQNLCTITSEPFTCRVDTATLVDGSYGFRAVATDFAGNSTTSALVSNRLVDNTVSSVSMEDPGPYLAGTVTLHATGSSTAGITSVTLQRALSGSTTWTDVCVDSTTPYSCAWNTALVADGLYDFRAVLVDGTAKVTTSSLVTSRVDNSPVRGYAVQSANGGPNPGRVEGGDTMTFTYSEPVNLSTITADWNGSAVPVFLRVRDGNLLGLGNSGDTVDFGRSGGSVNLGTVNLKGDFVKSSRSAIFNATMTASTVTVAGAPRTVVTVRLGTLSSGGGIRTSSTAGAMVWSPLSAVTDLFGRAASTAPVTESGLLDRDF